MTHRDKKYIYHLTALRNLKSIRAEGLLTRQALRAREISFADHADPAILGRRAGYDLERMVPFHFIHKSPFDYAVMRVSPDVDFVLLAVRRDHAQREGWQIVASHPLSGHADPRILPWAEGIDAIDWQRIDQSHRDYENDKECKVACMAEALSPGSVPFNAIHCIFVATAGARAQVLQLLAEDTSTYVQVNSNMFPKRG